MALSLSFCCERLAYGEVYRQGDYTFDIADAPPGEVKQAIISATEAYGAELLPPEMHPILFRWRAMPCAFVHKGSEPDRSQLQLLFTTLDVRTGFGIESCGQAVPPFVSYYFSDDPTRSEDQDAILELLGRPAQLSKQLNDYLSGRSGCYWRFKSGDKPLIEMAVVLINSSVTSEAERQQCLLIGTIASSGIPQPIVTSVLSKEWRRSFELNLLSLFVVYRLSDSVAAGTRQDVNQAIEALIDQMYASGREP